jgi:hypothetical protein
MANIDWVTQVRYVPKPWGYEERFALVPGQYCGKTLHIRAGHALSLQLHEHKEKPLPCIQGTSNSISDPP